VEDDDDESSYSIPLRSPRGESLSQTQKTEAFADSLETQFQPVTDPSFPAVIEMVDVALTPASEPKLTNPDEVHEAIRIVKFTNTPSPKGIPNRALRHLSLRVVSLLAQIFNAVFRTHYFPQVWKHARVISVLKPGKDPALTSFYRPISLGLEF